MFYSNFDQESLLDAELNSASNEYPLDIILIDPATIKTRNTIKNVMMMSSSHFYRYFLFLGQRGPSKVCQVGNHWINNLILHSTSYPDQTLSKNIGKYVENTNKKYFFYDTYPKNYIKNLFKTYMVIQI